MVNDKIKMNDMARLCQKYSDKWSIQDWNFALAVMTEVMRDCLLERKSFTLRNFATFATVVTESGTRIGRNPKKPDEDIVIKKRVRPKIIWSKSYKNEFKV